MAATPLEHPGALALATKWTGDADVLPLVGELTDTPAKAGAANRQTKSKHLPECIITISQLIFFVKKPRTSSSVEVNLRKASTYTQ
jgi:hypothetical protein